MSVQEQIAKGKIDEPESVKEQIAKGKMDDPDADLVELKRVLMGTCVSMIYLASLTLFIFNSVSPTLSLRITFLVLFNIANVLSYRMGWIAIIFEKLLRWNPLERRNELYTTKDVGGYVIDIIFVFATHSVLLVFPIVMLIQGIVTFEAVVWLSIGLVSALFQIWFYLPLFKRIIKA